MFFLSTGVYLSNIYTDFKNNMGDKMFRHLMVSADIVPNTFLPYLIVKEKTIAFDSIYKLTKRFDSTVEKPYFLIQTASGYKSVYPILTGIMALPFYFVPLVLNKIPTFIYHENILKVFILGRITATIYTAASVFLFYLVIDRFSSDTKLKIFFTLFYAFGTSSWSIASRGLWQHTTSQFFISIFLLLALASLKSPKFLSYTGLVLGLAVLVRPTNIILALTYSIYIFTRQRQLFVKFIAFALPAAVFLFAYNYIVFGSFFTEGYGARNDYNWSTPLSESLPGFLVSPARSFLFISPPLLLAFYSMYKLVKTKEFAGAANVLLKHLSCAFVFTLFLYAKWYTWDGANAFGYRMLSDYVPIIGLLSFLTVANFKKLGKIVLFVLILYSFYVHANAVFYKKSRCSKENNWNFVCLSPPTKLW